MTLPHASAPGAARPLRRRARTVASGLTVSLLLSACGGGGGGTGNPAPASDTGVPGAATASFVVSQASANALVQDLTQRARDLRLAGGLTDGIRTGASAPGTGTQAWVNDTDRQALASVPDRQAQAVGDLRDYSATLCSSGSASLDIPQALLDRFTSNPNASLVAGDRIGLVATRCVVRAPVDLGSVALGSFGVGATVDGRFDLTLAQRSGSDVQWTLVYSQFSYAPSGASAFAPLDATLMFGTVGGQSTYALDIPQVRFLAAPVLSEVGNTVTVASGKLRAPLASASGSGYADHQFKGWVMDASSLQATAGSVTSTGAGGAQVLVTAGAGGYSVQFSTGAGSTRFEVSR